LIWDESHIDLNNNPSITRSFQGESLEEILNELDARAGGGHEFGGDDDRNFFFRVEETSSAPESFGMDNYLSVEWMDDPKKDVNDVTVFFGEGQETGAVRVQDREQQKELAERMGSDRPSRVSITKNYPELTDKESARQKARALLNGRTEILTGEVTTWKSVGVRPGEVTGVSTPEQGRDSNFRIAQVRHDWGGSETVVSVAENVQGAEDELVKLSDEVQRLDLRTANDDVTRSEYFNLSNVTGIKQPIVRVYRRGLGDSFIIGVPNNSIIGETPLGDRREEKEKIIDTGE
jgi:hypothetical protein